MVFIDGGYLDNVLEHEHPGKKIDYARFAVELAKPGELLRAYYYHCLPYQSQTPTQDEKRRYAAKHKFMTALENLPRFQVRRGRLVRRFESGKMIFTQKGVDTRICVDMALLAGKRAFSRAALVSGDSDLEPESGTLPGLRRAPRNHSRTDCQGLALTRDTLVAGAFAAFALLLAAVGVYSIAAHVAAQRRYELGVRLALGATARQLVTPGWSAKP